MNGETVKDLFSDFQPEHRPQKLFMLRYTRWILRVEGNSNTVSGQEYLGSGGGSNLHFSVGYLIFSRQCLGCDAVYSAIHWQHLRANCYLHRHVRSTLIVGPVGSFQRPVFNNQTTWRPNGADRHLHCAFSPEFLAANLAPCVRLPVQKYRFAPFLWDKLRKHKYINERNSAFSVFDRSHSTFKLRNPTGISEWQ
jgi:hypothetical protein